jgi:hypothetical protein
MLRLLEPLIVMRGFLPWIRRAKTMKCTSRLVTREPRKRHTVISVRDKVRGTALAHAY